MINVLNSVVVANWKFKLQMLTFLAIGGISIIFLCGLDTFWVFAISEKYMLNNSATSSGKNISLPFPQGKIYLYFHFYFVYQVHFSTKYHVALDLLADFNIQSK